KNEKQHLIMLTATPHSGKQAEFQSLLGLLKPEFEELDMLSKNYESKRNVAAYYIQRRRRDVTEWLDEKTPFPERVASEIEYDLSTTYKTFYKEVWKFVRGIMVDKTTLSPQEKMRYWTALVLIRGVMSSPGAGLEMLRKRIQKKTDGSAVISELYAEQETNPSIDSDFGYEGDTEPVDLINNTHLTTSEEKTLSFLMDEIEKLGNIRDDKKAATTFTILKNWLKESYQPIVFCRFIQTANYLGTLLKPMLEREFKDIHVEVITSELNDDQRKERISDIGKFARRVIFATDCLSEGINLQDHFTAVLHYDLPWNPNRLEQREGRIDRYGQPASIVQTCLLFGKDNPMDGVVMRVLLQKARQIRKANGITVPFPENNESIMEAILNAVILNPAAAETGIQTRIDFGASDPLYEPELRVSKAYDKAINDELKIRNLFAQNPIVKELDIDKDLKETDESLGDPKTVEQLACDAFSFLGEEMEPAKHGWKIYPGKLRENLKRLLPPEKSLRITFYSPVHQGYYYLGRNHPFMDQLCHYLLGLAFHPDGSRKVARASVFNSGHVTQKTVIIQFRARNLIRQIDGVQEFLAEEMLLWGYQGKPVPSNFLSPARAKELLLNVKVKGDVEITQQSQFLSSELLTIKSLRETTNELARERSQMLVEAHDRYRKALHGKKYRVGTVLPMDLIGIYIIQPDIKL
ncbi:MAG TPA: helicase-related protein, partial [Candidatus Brocadiaceae bacterium]